MVTAPQISLKVIVITHFILSVWGGMMMNFLPTSYIYMNAFILAFGVWSIMAPDSVENISMFLILHIVSVLMDIIFLACFGPPASTFYNSDLGHSLVHQYQFSLGMAVLNLLLKPFSSFVLYRLYQDRNGTYGEFGIPGMPNFGVGGRQPGGYENIDQPVPSNSIDSSPTHGLDKSPLP